MLQPKTQQVNAGQNVQLFVHAEGAGPISYQWHDQAGPLAGETGETLSFTPSVGADAGYYHCVASNPWGTDTSDTAPLLVFDPRLANNAAFVGHSVPAQMSAGGTLNVGVTMKNTSSLSWSGPQGYALGVASDPAGFLMGVTRLQFIDPADVTIPLVGTHQFFAEIKAPATPGVYTIDFRMVEEFVEFFGQTGQITIQVVPPPNEASGWERYE